MRNATTKPAAATSTAPYDFTQQVGHLLRRAYQRHVAIFQQAIPDSQLTTPQFATLCAVLDLRSCSLKEIVTRTAIDQATIRGVVERLAARSLIEIAADPADGRKLSITISPTGRELVEHMIPAAREVTEKTFGNLNPAERVALVYLLGKICG